jgi:ribonuclease HI
MSCAIAAVGLSLVACNEPEPRSYAVFMDDRIARDGTLARCNENPREAQFDIECANASRAQAAIQLRLERERMAALERSSRIEIERLTRERDEHDQRARELAEESLRQQAAAYEKLWGTPAAGDGAEAELEPAPGNDAPAPFMLPEYLRAPSR